MSYSLNSLKGFMFWSLGFRRYIGNYIGEDYRGYDGDARSLDYSSHEVPQAAPKRFCSEAFRRRCYTLRSKHNLCCAFGINHHQSQKSTALSPKPFQPFHRGQQNPKPCSMGSRIPSTAGLNPKASQLLKPLNYPLARNIKPGRPPNIRV